MSVQSNPGMVAFAGRISLASAGFVLLLCGIELSGWCFNLPLLRNPLSRGQPSALASVCALVLIAAALLPHKAVNPALERAPAAIVLVFSAWTFICFCLSLPFGLDGFIQQTAGIKLPAGLTFGMAPNSSFNFMLISLSLLIRQVKVCAHGRPHQWLAFAAMTVAWLSITGHLYGEPVFYDIELFKPMAAPTALGQLLLSFSAFLTPPDKGLSAIFTSGSEGGYLARWAMPAAFVLPLVLGYITLSGQKAQHYDLTFCLSILVVLMSLSWALLVFWNAFRFDWLSRRRRLAEIRMRRHERTVRRILKKAHDQALELARIKSEFLANMSHEIRTPMNAVIGMADLLKRTALNGDQKRFVEVIENSGNALLDIINDILTLSKIEAGRILVNCEPFEPVKLVEKTVDILGQRARAKRISLMTAVDLQIPQVLIGDEAHLRQILLNLVSNAVKFTHQGKVIVRAAVDGCRGNDLQVRFTVSDTGIGLSQAAVRRLFQPFVQADGSITRQYGGTGLGLAICKRLTELLGGQIGVESTAGVGSTFWFAVPLARLPGEEGRQPVQLSGAGVLVLNVPGDEFAILKETIAAWGLPCDAGSAGEALPVLYSSKPRYHIVIVDLDGPELSSADLEALKDLSARPDAPTVILLTEIDQIGRGELAARLGFAEILTKPVKQSLLFNCIAGLSGGGITGGVPLPGTASLKDRQQLTRPGNGELVLVAEDNEMNREVISRQLQELGFAVVMAAGGTEALDKYRHNNCAVVLMDCQMPVMDGFQCTALIREIEQEKGTHVPVIAMTADTLEGDREKCLAAGMDDYISKPATLHQLSLVISRWLPGQRQHDTIFSPQCDSAEVAVQAKTQADSQHLLRQPVSISSLKEQFGQAAADEMIELFLTRTPQLLDIIKVSSQEHNTVELKAAAHELKGSCLVLGLNEMAVLCRQLESLAKEQQFETTEDICRQMEALFQQVKTEAG